MSSAIATLRNLNRSEKLREIASREKIPLHIAQLDVDDDISVENGMRESVALSKY
jgi:hypothetical protein